MEVNVHNDRREVFSVICTVLVAIQWWGKHFSTAMNQHAKIEEAVFSVGATLRLYNEDLRQLRDRLEGVSQELSSVKITEKRWQGDSWQLQQRIRIERVSGVGSWQNKGRKGIRLCKEDFTVCCRYSETVIHPMLGND
jgi:hypothetical protein